MLRLIKFFYKKNYYLPIIIMYDSFLYVDFYGNIYHSSKYEYKKIKLLNNIEYSSLEKYYSSNTKKSDTIPVIFGYIKYNKKYINIINVHKKWESIKTEFILDLVNNKKYTFEYVYSSSNNIKNLIDNRDSILKELKRENNLEKLLND